MTLLQEKLVFLGIDTSNYTTSCAVADANGRIIANIKVPLPVKAGERGLRQSDALFAHIRNMPECMSRIKGVLDPMLSDGARIAAIGYSAKPRNVEGSYMPCFLAGVACAEAMGAVASGARLIPLSHQEGHVRAAIYSSGHDEILKAPFGAFHVSGGTTDLLYCRANGSSMEIEHVGGSRDINAGQAIDRTGVLMGLRFPAGKELERISLEYDGEIKGVSVCVNGMDCNLSGLENKASDIYKKTQNMAYTGAYVFEFISKTLIKMTEAFLEKYGDIPIIYAGGVMSNAYIKKRLSSIGNTYFSEPEFSSDNAAGIALMARDRYIEEG